jgi:nitrite reductase (NO-forming)
MEGVRPLGHGSLAVLLAIVLLLGVVGGGVVSLWIRNNEGVPSTGGANVAFELIAYYTGYKGVGGNTAGVTNPDLVVRFGDRVTITVTNGENMMHNFEIDALGVRSADFMTMGQKVTVAFTADKEGTFAYYCGYHVTTMRGKLVVGAGSGEPIGPEKLPLDTDFIGQDPVAIPPTITRTTAATVDIWLEAKEVNAEIEPGTSFMYWTFNGTVPGPLFRVRVGDTVVVHFVNHGTMEHSVDFHAVTGPGGGMAATAAMPGETTGFSFKALVPGLYVYHCASPHIPSHIAMGMYGMILVEPEQGLPAVDAQGKPIKEFYVMQGELYTKWPVHTAGNQLFDPVALVAESPTYVVFNGRWQALTGNHSLTADVNDTVRIFFGVGGPNLISSFHVIGEIFDRVYNLGDLTDPPLLGVQTVLVPPGGSVVVEFKLEVPGTFLLVDHSLVRTIDKGSLGMLVVAGPSDPTIFNP